MLRLTYRKKNSQTSLAAPQPPPIRCLRDRQQPYSLDLRRIRSRRWQLHLLAICLHLVLIPVLFSLDIDVVTIISAEFPGDSMREAELRTPSLLRNQQLGLMHLWNRIVSRSSSSLPSSTSPPSDSSSPAPVKEDLPSIPVSVSLEEFKSALLEQIKLNNQIQATLLAAHRGRSGSLDSTDDNVYAYFSGSRAAVCRKVDRSKRRTIEWKPKKDRFLFAICLLGQMSNHLTGLEKHMFFAALLGRVLVFPSHKVDYDYSQILDINHINQCLGREIVFSYDDFVMKMKNKLKIDWLMCYIANPLCYLDEEHIKRLQYLGISLGKIEAAWPEDPELKVQKKRIVADIIPKFSSNDEVIAIRDMFYTDVEQECVVQLGVLLIINVRF